MSAAPEDGDGDGGGGGGGGTLVRREASSGDSRSSSATASPDTAAFKSNALYSRASDARNWEEQRATITDLYRDQNLRLGDVMAIMAREHNFFATERMYKMRIRKWGLDKKNKAKEVAAIVRLVEARRAAGKEETVIMLRGRPVEWSGIERYLRRHPDFLKNLGSFDSGGKKDVVADLFCRTPSPEPAAAAAASVPASLPPPGDLRVQDETTRIVRSYFDGSLDGGVWGADPRSFNRHRNRVEGRSDIGYWLQRLVFSLYAIAGASNHEGFRILDQCMDSLKEIAVHHPPKLIFILIWFLTKDLDDYPRQNLGDLRRSLSRYFRAMITIACGSAHPLALLLDRLRIDDDDDDDDDNGGAPGAAGPRATLGIEALARYAEDRMGRRHTFAMCFRLEYLRVLQHMAPQRARLERELRATAEALPLADAAEPFERWKSRFAFYFLLLDVLEDGAKHDEVGRLLDDIRAALDAFPADAPLKIFLYSGYHRYAARLALHHGRRDVALRHCRKRYAMCEGATGRNGWDAHFARQQLREVSALAEGEDAGRLVKAGEKHAYDKHYWRDRESYVRGEVCLQ